MKPIFTCSIIRHLDTFVDNLFKDFKIVLLENIRFYKEEERNDKKFVKKISSFGDVFINECFSCCHRNHSSISGIPTYLPSFPGKLLEEEILSLKNLVLSSNSENNIAVLGGAKVSTKLKIIDFYAKNYSQVIIGGAMANTFLSALGNEIGNSLYEKKMVKTAADLISIYGDKILLPKDVVVTSKKDLNLILIKNIDEVEKDHLIMDIGPQTRMSFYNEIIKAENLLWNGPLGYFEKTPFDAGTNYVLKGVKNNKYKNFLPETELLLIYAARHEHVKKLLIPTLKKNNVICDRFIHSTICYQIIMNKINIRKLKFLHKEFAFNLLPNISFFLNLNPKEGVKRSLSIKKTEIKYEKKENRFHEKIRAEFENLSKKDKHLINVDASNSIESIHRKIINILNKKKFFKKNLPYSI